MNAALGQRVWVTRSRGGNDAWVVTLRKAGFHPLRFDALRFRVLAEQEDVVRKALKDVDWTVFTSPRGVRSLAEMEQQPDADTLLACVGHATARACAEHFREADLFSVQQTANDLGQQLLQQRSWSSAALVSAQEARPELGEMLLAAGKQVRPCAVYATALPDPAECHLQWQAGDVVLLASPSSLAALEQGGSLPHDLRLVSIGPTTSQAIRSAGYEVAGESSNRNISGLIQVVQQLRPVS